MVPCTTRAGALSVVIGVSSSAASTLRVWPWFARIRKCAGLELST